MSINFETAVIPSKARSGREPMENPFAKVFPSDDRALVFKIEQGRNSVEARRVMRQVRSAARATNRTGRIMVKDLPDGSAQFTIWTVEKIIRHKR